VEKAIYFAGGMAIIVGLLNIFSIIISSLKNANARFHREAQMCLTR
jgi:hypothetical protein